MIKIIHFTLHFRIAESKIKIYLLLYIKNIQIFGCLFHYSYFTLKKITKKKLNIFIMLKNNFHIKIDFQFFLVNNFFFSS
jgi:hypothetical protein